LRWRLRILYGKSPFTEADYIYGTVYESLNGMKQKKKTLPGAGWGNQILPYTMFSVGTIVIILFMVMLYITMDALGNS